MESMIILVAGLVAVAFFKASIRKGAKYVEQVVDTNINEEQSELIERSMNAYDEVIAKCGEDFKTPEEVLALLCKKNRRVKNQQKQAA